MNESNPAPQQPKKGKAPDIRETVAPHVGPEFRTQEALDLARQQARQPDLSAEIAALRAENAVLRDLHQAELDRKREEGEHKRRFEEFMAWNSMTTEEKTQAAADKLFAGQAGDLWEVALTEHPKVRLKAASEFDAIGKYNLVCGILQSEHKHTAALVKKAG